MTTKGRAVWEAHAAELWWQSLTDPERVRVQRLMEKRKAPVGGDDLPDRGQWVARTPVWAGGGERAHPGLRILQGKVWRLLHRRPRPSGPRGSDLEHISRT